MVGLFSMIGVCSIIVSPVVWHNANKGAGWTTISTNNEINALLGNCPFTPNYKTSYLAHRPLESLSPEAQSYVRKFAASHTKSARDEATREMFRYVLENPGITLWRTANRVRAFWGFDYVISRRLQIHYNLSDAALAGLVLLEGGGYVVVIILCLIGTFRTWWGLRAVTRVLIPLLVFGYQIPYALAFSHSSFHFPVIAVITPLAALGIIVLTCKHALSRLTGEAWLWAGLLVFTLIQVEYAYHAVAYRDRDIPQQSAMRGSTNRLVLPRKLAQATTKPQRTGRSPT